MSSVGEVNLKSIDLLANNLLLLGNITADDIRLVAHDNAVIGFPESDLVSGFSVKSFRAPLLGIASKLQSGTRTLQSSTQSDFDQEQLY